MYERKILHDLVIEDYTGIKSMIESRYPHLLGKK